MQQNKTSKESKAVHNTDPSATVKPESHETAIVDLQAVTKKRQKFAEELQTVEKQVFF